MDEPLVTVIILNWNGGEEVIGCIEHVMAQSYGPIETVVVDNASMDNSRKDIRCRFPEIKLVENQENVGFASGMNQGIDLARGEYVLLLNQDAWIRDGFIESAVQVMSNAPPDVGMVAGKIYKLDGAQKTDQVVGGGLLLRKRFQLVGDHDLSTEHYTLSPTWCCPFLRRAMLDDVYACSGHYFDDRYFAYGEDLDLTLRAQLLGWRCSFSPDLVAWHSHSGSLGGKVRIWEKPPVFRKHTLRNRYLTIIKDLPVELILYLAPFITLTEIATWLYFLFRSPGTIVCLVQAYVETAQMLPETIHLRYKVQAAREVPARYLWQFFRGF